MVCSKISKKNLKKCIFLLTKTWILDESFCKFYKKYRILYIKKEIINVFIDLPLTLTLWHRIQGSVIFSQVYIDIHFSPYFRNQDLYWEQLWSSQCRKIYSKMTFGIDLKCQTHCSVADVNALIGDFDLLPFSKGNFSSEKIWRICNWSYIERLNEMRFAFRITT